MIRTRVMLALVALVSAAALSGAAHAQQDPEPTDLLEDFIHYTLIAKPDLAAASAQLLLDGGLTAGELADALDSMPGEDIKRFDDAVKRAQFVPELEYTASALAKRVEDGRLELARNPQRIKQAIAMLSSTVRGKRLATTRLVAAGEYAVPHLLREITDGQEESLKIDCAAIITQIGRAAVTPLCVAVTEVDDASRRTICDMLGDIGYPHAGPYLKMLANDGSVADYVRDAASRAFARVGATDASLHILFGDLAREYFDESGSLIAYPYEATNNVWSYDSFGGLEATPVSTEIYSEIMAMKMAAMALSFNADDRDALGLYVAANLRRENQLPAGMDDPIYGSMPYTPAFYATVFGTQTCQDVLGMAIDAVDTPLVRDALTALAETTGGSNLFDTSSGRLPLTEALQYPDRRVRYESALILGGTHIDRGFNGDISVVPTLAGAVRTGNVQFAVIVAPNDEDLSTAANLMENMGFEVVASGFNVAEIADQVAAANAVDLVFAQAANADEAESLLLDIRVEPKMAAAPVLFDTPATELTRVKRAFRGQASVHAARAGGGEQALAESLDELMLRAAGGRMTEIEAMEYAIRSLATLRDIAISGSTVYNLVDAETALIDALRSHTGGTRLLVADILALIDTERAQHTLLDAAFDASGSEQVALLTRAADSVKRFGNKADPRHIAALLSVVSSASGDTAEAAARVHGAMNLPVSNAIDLIEG